MRQTNTNEHDREKLADLEHDRWSRWMHYMFSKGTFKDDGTWIMSKRDADRWMRQMGTSYAALSESEKESDRREVDRFLEAIKATNGQRT